MARFNITGGGSFTLTNAGGNADLMEIRPADDKPVRLVGLILGQTSEVADAAEEIIHVQILRLPATFTTGNGSAATITATKRRDVGANSFAAEFNGATVATTSGTIAYLEEFAWNMRAGPLEKYWDALAAQYDAVEGEGLIIRCVSTVADDVTFTITVIVEED